MTILSHSYRFRIDSFTAYRMQLITTANSISGLRLIGDYNIAAQTQFNGVEFGGISGIDRDSEGHYWAISD
ncbi:hypothetical protein ACW7EJ_20140, partial [Acinetobacter soli]